MLRTFIKKTDKVLLIQPCTVYFHFPVCTVFCSCDYSFSLFISFFHQYQLFCNLMLKVLQFQNRKGLRVVSDVISGTNLTERFPDQFDPLLIGQTMPWSSSESIVIRMPLSSEYLNDRLESGVMRVKRIFDRFLEHASRTLLFLKSVVQVYINLNQ